MALIAMAVFSTAENKKDEYLQKTLQSLMETVDFNKHRLILSVNGFTDKTTSLLEWYKPIISGVIYNPGNIGTAEAINKAWACREPGENCVKMDDDVVIYSADWLYLMEEAIRRNPNIGQIGLKRRDCWEWPGHENMFYKSELAMLPHQAGEKWIVVEYCKHIMGTCVMHSAKLLDTIGYLWQPGLYGFDDSFMSLRSRMAGFSNAFLVGVDIEHIDRGDTGFQKWKEQQASAKWQAYHEAVKAYQTGTRSLFYDPFKINQPAL